MVYKKKIQICYLIIIYYLIKEHCPQLKKINIHIGISDYYQDVENRQNRRDYALIIKKLEVKFFFN